jgi:O-antigen/teichoic acid export membrane protein
MFFGKTLIENSINRLLNTLIVFFTIVFLTRALGASDFGVLSLMIANASVLNLVSSLGITSGITYNLSSKSLHENKILTVTFGLLLAQFFFISIFEYSWLHFFDSNWILKGNGLVNLSLGICFYLSISTIEKYCALFYGRQQFILPNNIVLLGNLILLLILLLLYIQKTENIFIFFIVYILAHFSQAIVLISAYHIINKVPVVVTYLNKQEVKLFFSYSFLAFITNILQFFAYRADYWIVEYFRGSMQLGLYSVSVRLAQLFWILPNLIAAIIFPQVAGKLTKGNEYNFLSMIRLMNTCNIVAGLCLLLLSPYLVVLFFGEEYSDSVIPFQILLPGVIGFCITTVLASYFAGINKLKVNFGGTILCLLVILVLDLVLIPGYGIAGAAIASCMGYTLTAVYSLTIFKQLTQVPFRHLLFLTRADLIYFKKVSTKYLKL